MKAVLVIDMPTECIECPFHRLYADGWLTETHCSITAKRNRDGVNTRADWCPLKPLPTKITTATLSEREQERTELFTSMALLKTYADGWNDCLKEIEK